MRHGTFTHLQEIKGAKKGLLDTEQAAETASAGAETSLTQLGPRSTLIPSRCKIAPVVMLVEQVLKFGYGFTRR